MAQAEEKDSYILLGITRQELAAVGSDPDDIDNFLKKARGRETLKHHPDRVKDKTQKNLDAATEKMKLINAAYNSLSPKSDKAAQGVTSRAQPAQGKPPPYYRSDWQAQIPSVDQWIKKEAKRIRQKWLAEKEGIVEKIARQFHAKAYIDSNDTTMPHITIEYSSSKAAAAIFELLKLNIADDMVIDAKYRPAGDHCVLNGKKIILRHMDASAHIKMNVAKNIEGEIEAALKENAGFLSKTFGKIHKEAGKDPFKINEAGILQAQKMGREILSLVSSSECIYAEDYKHLMTLIGDGASLKERDENGNTPLMLLACRRDRNGSYNFIKIVEAMTDKDPSLIRDVNNKGQTALMQLRVDRSEYQDYGGLVHLFAKTVEDLNRQDHEGNSTLMHAIMKDDFLYIDLERYWESLDYNLQNKQGETALIRHFKYGGSVEDNHVYDMMCHTGLLDHGAKVFIKDNENKTALDYAIDSICRSRALSKARDNKHKDPYMYEIVMDQLGISLHTEKFHAEKNSQRSTSKNTYNAKM